MITVNVIKTCITYLSIPFIISVLLVPLVKKAGIDTGIYALENKRTVHHGKIVRIGGIAIFLAFYASMAIFVKGDKVFNGIMIGGIIVFMTGLIDDIFNIRPLYKLAGQCVAALATLLISDIRISGFEFLGRMDSIVIFVISFIWLVGVSNAINLIDGLDGLSSGISIIVLTVMGLLGFLLGRKDICVFNLMLIGATGGFLVYNFHPASIFVGDCGALFLGFMIAAISLLGFKTSAVITLLFPIIILFVPLGDTALAILRRKSQHKKITEADKGHLHHVLMYKLGFSHRNTVLLLYLISCLFGLSAIIIFFNKVWGTIFLALLCIVFWIFIELTGMINPNFHPLIGLCRRICGHPKKKKDAFFEANRINDNNE